VLKLNDQNNQANAKDIVIAEQIMTVKKLTNEVHSLEHEKEKLKTTIKYYQNRSKGFESDKNFL
jgi:low affinity Fe/Cu permease